ncbi:MAG: hypothetical protein D6739_04730, partial [Nitrospirae bacterium]
ELLRQLRDLDTIRDPYQFAGTLAVAGVHTAEALATRPGLESPHTLSRVLKVLWWGDELTPEFALDYKGLYGLLANQTPSGAVDFAFEVPGLASKVVAILSDDPALKKSMALLGGSCAPLADGKPLLLAPDVCKSGEGKGARNLILGSLGDLRRLIKPGLTDDQHENDPDWGYLRTLPVLDGADANGVPRPANLGSEELWSDTVARVNNLNLALTDPTARAQAEDDATKAVVGVIDLARMAVGFVDQLPTANQSQVSASQVLADSIFADAIGGETFSGIGGGVWHRWTLVPGEPPRDLDGRVRLELVGQFAIPALMKIASQLTYDTTADGGYLLKLQAGGNYPDLNALSESIGVSVPANQIAESWIGSANAELYGWLGATPTSGTYARLWAHADARLGAIDLGRLDLSGYMAIPSGPGGAPLPADQLATRLDVGMCGEMSQQLNPLAFLGGGVNAGGGGYFFKEGTTAGLGLKVKASAT